MFRGWIDRPGSRMRTAMRLGARDALLFACARMLAAISGGRVRLRKYYIMAQPVHDRPLLPPRRGASLSVACIDEGDPLAAQFPRPAHVLDFRRRQRAQCIVARDGERFVGFLWHVRDRYEEDEVRAVFALHPAGSAAWDFDLHVEARDRMGPAFLKLWDAANARLREDGVRWSCSRVSAWNPDSLSSHARLGARRIGAALFLNAGRMQCMLSTLAPCLHLSFGAARPVIAIDTRGLVHPADARTDSPTKETPCSIPIP